MRAGGREREERKREDEKEGQQKNKEVRQKKSSCVPVWLCVRVCAIVWS